MNYCGLKKIDTANGLGVRVSLFVSGCRNHCPGCFQPETWDFSYGSPFTEAVREEVLRLLAPDYIRGLTLLGGEPFEPANQAGLLPLLREVRIRYPSKTVWAFSGYTLEQIRSGTLGPPSVTEEILSCVDVLVDGPFVESLKNLQLRFRGSSNQRLIDLRQTLAAGTVVLWDDGR